MELARECGNVRGSRWSLVFARALVLCLSLRPFASVPGSAYLHKSPPALVIARPRATVPVCCTGRAVGPTSD